MTTTMDSSASATPLAAPVGQRRDTTRSERMLREMLNKDGLARSRSQSRGSNGSLSTAAGNTPRKPRPLTTNTSHNSLARNPSASALSMGSSCADIDDGPMFAAGGFGAPSAGVHHVHRPHVPSPRKTHDGIVSPSPMRASSPVPAIPSRHATAPAPLVHANSSSPLFTASHTQKQSSRDWSFDESSSPSTTSSSSPSHNPSTPSSFNLHLASEFCRQQQGYVSFAEIEGLGRPAGEDEDERKERERLEAECRRKKAWFGWGWLEDGILTAAARPKTPGAPAAGSENL